MFIIRDRSDKSWGDIQLAQCKQKEQLEVCSQFKEEFKED